MACAKITLVWNPYQSLYTHASFICDALKSSIVWICLKGLCTDGDVRLEDGDREYEGKIDICYNGKWGTVCGDSDIDDSVAEVVCKQLGFSLHG